MHRDRQPRAGNEVTRLSSPRSRPTSRRSPATTSPPSGSSRRDAPGSSRMGEKHFVLEALHATDPGRRRAAGRRRSGWPAWWPAERPRHGPCWRRHWLVRTSAPGASTDAERHARSAVDYFATTDFVTFHANSALHPRGRPAGGRSPRGGRSGVPAALDLYRQKGSLVSVETRRSSARGLTPRSHSPPHNQVCPMS